MYDLETSTGPSWAVAPQKKNCKKRMKVSVQVFTDNIRLYSPYVLLEIVRQLAGVNHT